MLLFVAKRKSNASRLNLILTSSAPASIDVQSNGSLDNFLNFSRGPMAANALSPNRQASVLLIQKEVKGHSSGERPEEESASPFRNGQAHTLTNTSLVEGLVSHESPLPRAGREITREELLFALDEELTRLREILHLLRATSTQVFPMDGMTGRKRQGEKHALTPAGRMRISEAQKRRWAKQRVNSVP